MLCAQHARCISFLHCHTQTLPKKWQIASLWSLLLYDDRAPVRNVSPLHRQDQVSRWISEWTGTPSTVPVDLQLHRVSGDLSGTSDGYTFRWLAVSVSGLRACKIPRDQGIIVTPPGLLLSQWDSLAGSSREGISTESKLSRLITPLTAF